MNLSLLPSVLVLEDSDEDFDTLLEAAKRAELSNPLHRATTGDDCLALLRGEAGAGLRPGIVLLDLNTPGTDGREALVAIRTNPSLRSVPVVVLSTSANPRDVSYCYEQGANAYHVKPVRYDEHLGLLNKVFAYWLRDALLPGASGSLP